MAHYTRRQKLKAVKLLEQGCSKRKVILMLGYPSLSALKNWAREMAKTGDVKNVSSGRPPKYTPEQRKAALRAFKRNGGAFKATCRQLGYPCVELLRRWVRAAAPRKGGIIGTPVKYRNTPHPEIPDSKRRDAVQKMADPETNVSQLAADLEVSRTTLYIWRSRYGKGRAPRKSMKESQILQAKVAELAADKTLSAEERLDAALKRVAELDSLVNRLGQESEQLHKDIYQLRLEKDALVQTALLLKKGEGVGPKSLSNRAKTLAIDALRATYPLKDLCAVFDLAKSSYCYQKKALERPDKYAVDKSRQK